MISKSLDLQLMKNTQKPKPKSIMEKMFNVTN